MPLNCRFQHGAPADDAVDLEADGELELLDGLLPQGASFGQQSSQLPEKELAIGGEVAEAAEVVFVGSFEGPYVPESAQPKQARIRDIRDDGAEVGEQTWFHWHRDQLVDGMDSNRCDASC